ncbi:Peptide chain release factor 2 [Candidatus Terasakiella magnetica]|uniref:Peptide chain release factor 2 n=1 Tax=Candidatus Terasakiella magnetica TaxID=1867952 RepID=A0A1C3RLB4_9PROT|nr:peptide chain release factor 2 [Candidatus Terasakiella magnetica]SCA58057.1 Peptide chain release factor 2 [Candidatus Terasakiella magnetica]
MRAEVETQVEEIRKSLKLLRKHLDYDNAVRRLEELNALSEDPDLWNDPKKAQELMKERTRLENGIKALEESEQELSDNIELIELGEMEDDQDTITEAEECLNQLQERAAKEEIETLLSGEADGNNCFLEINSGAGGTEACDWANIMLRMYSRWCDSRGYKIEYLEETAGEEAGIKSVTLKVTGHNAYGWLKTETGTHRLVRISPFDSSARRHTSFAAVSCSPEIDDNIEIEIEEKDLRVDTYRASGAGGQHVNKTDSAIRITHLPTGIVVQCQNDRSQHKNRAAAYKMLRARLYEAELQRREAESQAEHDAKTEIGWGRQIRSYVLQPYQMIKDLRTNVETSNSQAVLDGDLDQFMAAALANRIEGSSDSE